MATTPDPTNDYLYEFFNDPPEFIPTQDPWDFDQNISDEFIHKIAMHSKTRNLLKLMHSQDQIILSHYFSDMPIPQPIKSLFGPNLSKVFLLLKIELPNSKQEILKLKTELTKIITDSISRFETIMKLNRPKKVKLNKQLIRNKLNNLTNLK